MSAKSIFITGTDTGVGKTIASATIAMLLRRLGHSVGVMKPVTSGCIERDGKLISEDAELLCFGAGVPVTPDCTPYLLRAPLAPSVSASQDGVRINFQVIKEAYDRLAQKHEFVIVEGAGGLMVPLAGGLLVADLALHLGLPIAVVARPNLGTINHTLLTTFTARTMGLNVKGVIVNRYPDTPDQAESYAPHMIDSLSGSQLLGLFPDIQGADERETVTRVTDHLLQQPATGIMLREMFD
ncbi:dethiobiotin synthase [Geomonas terrae]|uniref:ATP-dependent dethiobiotin synthetase BioD n=1 Tax=Geomonas terrae TaxID=2562681 RepID=A0A4S1CGK1_9BACT|nr:dethiobiotin synthase [Geomonas terrae]TGU72669.1 dethiobiotin synthase [Geomonas terrae]